MFSTLELQEIGVQTKRTFCFSSVGAAPSPSQLSRACLFPDIPGPLPLHSISVLDYPHCVVHELPELTAESLVSGPSSLASPLRSVFPEAWDCCLGAAGHRGHPARGLQNTEQKVGSMSLLLGSVVFRACLLRLLLCFLCKGPARRVSQETEALVFHVSCRTVVRAHLVVQ